MILTVAEASRMTGINKIALYKRIYKGTLKAKRVRGHWFLKSKHVNRLEPGKSLSLNPGNYRHGLSHSPTHSSYLNMMNRCYNPKASNYSYYGGRGISVCKRWRDSFQSFVEDMGLRPAGKTLDREDVEGDYSKSNCRWATKQEQRNNRRDSK